MSDSLLIGASGLEANQQMLDVVGNNLANSNTIGFKSQRITFDDLVYQKLSDATSSTSQLGGTNPVQVGLGVRVGSIDTLDQQGSIEATGRELDLAIQGNGYFVARSGTGAVYTRAGALGVDSENYLVDPATGNRIQRFGTVGEGGAAGPAFQTTGDEDIQIPVGAQVPGQATSDVSLEGNLSAAATGPQAQVLTTGQAFNSGGAGATTDTLLDSLDDITTQYAAGDQLRVQGTTSTNDPVNFTFNVDDTTTLGDVIDAVNANVPGATASLDADGNLVLQSSTTGPSTMSLAISDVAGNVGGLTWGNHTLATTTAGADATSVPSTIQVYDSQGTAHTLNLSFQKQADNTWTLTAALNPSDGVLTSDTVSGITFNSDGSFNHFGGSGSITAQFAGLNSSQAIGFNFGTPGSFGGLTQMGGSSGAAAVSQDGFAPGALNSLTVDADGTINGNFSNGRTIAIAQLAIASFANADALDRVGQNYFASNVQSGDPQLGAALTSGRGSIQQDALEDSNVDVSQEFAQLIIAQRGFEVNSRTMSVSAQIVQDLISIIH